MKSKAVALFCGLMLLAGCGKPSAPGLPAEGNAVYYWRTDFRLDSAEQAFLNDYDVKRIYCRYFDVVNDPQRGPQPNATITFSADVSRSSSVFPHSIDIVPTVFIMEDCMHHANDSLARLIVNRIVQMNQTNDVDNVHEIQIDCDYTQRSRHTYYQFLQQVRDEAARHRLALSTTIRLHQLAMPAPPADYGVLMLYNTGDPARYEERNPILDTRDVEPYLRYLPDYPLPLAAAYPVFLWQRNIYGVHVEHVAEASQVMAVKQAVEAQRQDLRQLILTYHLSTDNINRYTPEDYAKIYHH